MGNAILELREVRKVYGDVVAVESISLVLAKGEFLTFLGPSGSGKTTTLVMVAGLQDLSSGTILLDGQSLNPLPPYKRNVGMVFQHYALFPHMTVAQNIGFPLEMRRVDRAERQKRVAEALTLVGLPDYGGRYPRQLSGGQQQRVALARAIVFEPPLLLMDEPLGALDKKLREQMQLEVMRLHKELGISILYVTHDQEEALIMSDRIAVFNGGRIEQIGAPQELYERPATRFVADFIGESNFFPARIDAVNGAACQLDGPHGRLRARNTIGLKAGQQALVAVRPERIRVAETGGDDETLENGVEGWVSEVIYLGQSRKYVIRLQTGLEVTALQQAHEADRRSFGEGDRVRLSWSAQEANALADDEAAGAVSSRNDRDRR